jgi:hypothetical protein
MSTTRHKRFFMIIALLFLISGCASTAQRGAMYRAYSGIQDKEYDFALKRLLDAESYVEPTPALQAEILYLRGICFEGLSKLPEARGTYKYLISNFKPSQYTYMASERLESINTDRLLELDLAKKQNRQFKKKSVNADAVSVPKARQQTFQDRIEIAKAVEYTENGRNYIDKHIIPIMKQTMSNRIKECLAMPDANREPFVVVADVNKIGEVTNVDYEPKTNTATCYVDSFRKLKFEAPLVTHDSLPIYINMKVKK